ncbi:12-oxophytodienoate reductase 1 [Hondaea fermentalgiana]|uniref:12-oxophytodienoate reductase 1 n=1 Tax=Hondaea fermentalgiana TaxID=2315210 RepID=A0A2R5GMN8_9STRA|nr:12-oxophytodienoate reductase 1 [Hondaea fermentalgiana]|eukprot:GBG29571.1 12-oxophytodienoate reductase 1 [Hondaea fermentalgiana]
MSAEPQNMTNSGKNTSPLLMPVKIAEGTENEVTTTNRVFMAPMTRGRSTENHVPQDFMADYYSQRSTAGLIFAEATGISQQGLGWWCAPGIWSDEQVEAWKPIVKRTKLSGTSFYLQLWHMGRQGHSDVMKETPVSASEKPMSAPIPAKNHERKEAETPHALTKEEIAGVVKDYGKAARNAKEAGFDGVEIHAANGYLIDQFIQSCTNERTDDYGGSIENRLRFLREVLDEVLTVFPKERISVRLSPNGAFAEMGSEDNLETFKEAFKYLAGKRIGMIHLMDGLDWGFHEKCDPFTATLGREIIRETQKDEGIATILVCNAGYTHESADLLIKVANGESPLVEQAVAFGRPFIANPDLVDRFRNGWELAPTPGQKEWWGNNVKEGYSDYPNHEGEVAHKNEE